MVSHRHRCIFVEVPKTGSTSIRAVLGPALKPHLNIWEIRTQMETQWMQRGGRRDRLMESLYGLLPKAQRIRRGREQFAAYFKFGFVRNPWDRVVSLYERNEAVQMKEQMTFEQFVDWIEYASATCVHSSPHRQQLDWFVSPDGEILVDFIGRFERLEEDWATVAEKIGVSPSLPHRKANPRARPYTDYYNERTREVIARKFQVDIERFAYVFGG